jgi:hypothetical protein
MPVHRRWLLLWLGGTPVAAYLSSPHLSSPPPAGAQSWRPKVYTEAELAERARAAERDQLLSMWGMVDRDGSGALDATELREVRAGG